MNPLDIARVAHEVNRAYCQSIGDQSQLPWQDAPAWQIESALDGVGFHLRNPWSGPEASHENWFQKKRAEGWTFGLKDTKAKTHPCMVQFHELPPEQQAKDLLFLAVVRALEPHLRNPQPVAHEKLPNQQVTLST